MSKNYYETSIEHLLAELKRIDLMIMAEVEIVRRQVSSEANVMKMYGISEYEIDTLIQEAVAAIRKEPAKQPELNVRLEQMMEQQKKEIIFRTTGSYERNVALRLERLRELFRLSPDEVDILLISLAAEMSNRYQRFFAYLQDDKNQIRPNVGLVLKLLQGPYNSDYGNIDRFSLFADTAPLVRANLIYLEDETHRPGQPLLNRVVKTDGRIRDYLLGSDNMSHEMDDCATCHEPRLCLDDLLIREEFKNSLLALVRNMDLEQKCAILYLQGGYGTGKHSIAEGLCQVVGLKLLSVNLASVIQLKPVEFRRKLSGLVREAELQEAALYIDNFDDLLPGQPEEKNNAKETPATRHDTLLHTFISILVKRKGLIFFAGKQLWEPRDMSGRYSFFRIPVPGADTQEREQFWRSMRKAYPRLAGDVDLPAISDRFKFSPGQIHDALATATSISRWRDPLNTVINSEDLGRACRLQSNRGLERLAQNISSCYKWDDLVLAPGPRSMLEEIRARVIHRALVYEHWGFDKKLAMGKGLHLLFSGPPGTGKTMAADVLANEFALSLYKIDLSSVVSKYIGETEKNLSEVFHEGETSNAILFFDEAEALFGKRSEVKDAHDRHANIEVGYLLQRMEQYAGIVILATNFRRNMDDAFTRRLHFCVDFPLPDREERLKIWNKIWPEELPRAADLDMEFLADRLHISGGYIRNIALTAAFLAAEEATHRQVEPEVTMEHLLHATRREYQKMGQILKQSTLNK